MNVNNVVRPKKRFKTAYLYSLNIQAYGNDNLYPQRMFDLVKNSPTGSTCIERYYKFIEGNGLNDTPFSEFVCNSRGDSVDDLYRLVAKDMAYYGGFALLVNYNLACDIVEVLHIPFDSTRLEEEDEFGRMRSVSVHPDWTGTKTRKGRRIPVNKDTVVKYPVFNPKPEVVLAQIAKAGGIEHYRGQIYWYSSAGRFVYPTPVYDKVVTNLSSDEGLDNVKYRNVRNGFLLSGMFVHKRGMTMDSPPMFDENGNPLPAALQPEEDSGLGSTLTEFQGDENSCSIMEVEINQDEDMPNFIPVEGTNYDKKFECTEKSVVERIYSAFGQEPWFCIRTGKVGFSGDILSDAYEYYNSYVNQERRVISSALKKIFDRWEAVVNPSGDYTIQPLVYFSNNNTESDGTPDNA